MNQRIDGAAGCCHAGQFSDFNVAHSTAPVNDPGAIDALAKPVQAAPTVPATGATPAETTATDGGDNASLMKKMSEIFDKIMHASSLSEILGLLKEFISAIGSTGGTSTADSGASGSSDPVSKAAVPVTPQASTTGTPVQTDDPELNAIGSKKAVQTPAAGAAAAPAAASDGAAVNQGDINIQGGGKKTMIVINNSDREQNFACFSNPTPGMSSSFGMPDGFVTLKPGESANLKVPDQWSGYVQQMNNYTKADYDANKVPEANNFKASRAEPTFNKDGSLYFNSSIIDGYNASLKMSANGQSAGSNESVLDKIAKTNPGLIETVGGQKVVRGTQFFTDKTDMEARDALDKAINHNANPSDLNGNKTVYVVPNDDKAVRGTQGDTLTLEFGKP